MPPLLLIRVIGSPSFRIAAAFAAAVTVTTFIVFALVYWQFYIANVALVRFALQDEVQKTSDIPAGRLQHQLELRLTQDLRHLDYVGLYDSRGDLTFGDVPPGLNIPVDGHARHIQLPQLRQNTWRGGSAVFVAAKRNDGGQLVLGRSLIYVDELAAAMLQAFTAAILPVIMIAIAGGTVVSLRASRRLITIQKAISRVMEGELQVRLPTRGTPDDIDKVVRAVNLMLDEIARLVNQLKSVGDNIAHDLRAPLSIMRARLERGLASASEAGLRQITRETLADLERAMVTVTALLRISELETSLRRSAFGKVDLADVSGQAFELYAPFGEAKGLTMTIRVAKPVLICGDADLLCEAVANLIDNAIKFTPPGGTVTVACGLPEALVRVADTGPGIDPGEREKVVQRFYRSQAVSDHPGLGIGLNMAATILELHGFHLRISAGSPGAIFDITGPSLARASVEARSQEDLVGASNSGTATI